VLAVSEHVAELYQEEQQRGSVLESRHDRLRRVPDERTQPHEAEQRLKGAADEDDREDDGERVIDVSRPDDGRIGVRERKDEGAEEERGDDAWRVDGRRPVAAGATPRSGSTRAVSTRFGGS
jgi:hypothetical protein